MKSCVNRHFMPMWTISLFTVGKKREWVECQSHKCIKPCGMPTLEKEGFLDICAKTEDH